MGTLHTHVLEAKTAWPDKTWVLGHRPDGGEMIMIRRTSPPSILHRDEDWGFTNEVVTMVYQPTDGQEHLLFYSYDPALVTGLSAPIAPVTSPQYLYPREVGATAQWTSGAPSDIDDPQPIANHDGDATYMVYTAPAAGTAVHLFKKSPFLAMPAGQAITNVILRGAARGTTGAASGGMRTRLRIAGVTQTDTLMFSMIAPNTTYQVGSVTFATNPATGNPWTSAEVEEMQIGAAMAVDGSGTWRITALFLEVNYA